MAVRTITKPTCFDPSVGLAVNGNMSAPDVKPSSPEGGTDPSARPTPKPKEKPIQEKDETRGGVTFAHQDKLPKLPIPELEATCKKYLAALEPLQSAKEHLESQIAVKEFLKADGPALQEKLRQYAEGRANYIEQFWYDSYLNFDNPVVLNLNPFFLLEDDPTPARNNQITRATSLIISALSFVRAVRREELPPDEVRGQPLDMYQYARLFGTARIPTENGCQIGQDPQAKHIVVMCHGQFYWFDVLDENSDLIMTEKDIALNLQVICNDASLTPIQEAAKSAVGVLSTENRKLWSSLRELLHKDEGSNNSDCLNIVDSALFVVCLDYTEPLTTADLCMNMLCGTSKIEKGVQVGTCTNRWYDKLQIIVCKNGSAGINFEHTGVDGHTVLRFASDVFTDTVLRFAKSISGQAPSLWASMSPDPVKRDPDSFGDVETTPHKLEWDMIPELSTALRFAETHLADLIGQNEFETLEFMHYGKNFMTSNGFSPDAFVQMAFQAAYYGLYGRMECTYEPAMTKTFYHGRTEAIRSVTPESVEFVQTFWDEYPAGKKVDALRKACQKHTAITRESSKGQGHDRHLYALYCLWQRTLEDIEHDGEDTKSETSVVTPSNYSRAAEHAHTLPAIFADPGWSKLTTTVLSTSNCGNPCLRHFGFGPTSGDGFGIGYIIKDGSISICASSKHRQTRRFIDALEAYFLEMRRLIKSTQRNGSVAEKKGSSRVREAEEKKGREVRGRRITTSGVHPRCEKSDAEEDDLGGYGFFDSGLLQSALLSEKAEDMQASRQRENLRRIIGRRLQLVDY